MIREHVSAGVAGIDQLHEAGDDAGRPPFAETEKWPKGLGPLPRAGLIDELIDEGMEEMAAASDPLRLHEPERESKHDPGRTGSRG